MEEEGPGGRLRQEGRVKRRELLREGELKYVTLVTRKRKKPAKDLFLCPQRRGG